MANVNKRLSEYIRNNDVSISEIAKKIGVAQSSLSRTLSSDDLKISQLIEITGALGLPVTYFFDGKEHISNEEIETDKKRIVELENSNIELSKTVGVLMDTLQGTNEQMKKLLQAVSVLFISKDKEEAEKARLMLVSIVEFFMKKDETTASNNKDKGWKSKHKKS